jgi:transcriptional regulator
MYLPSYFAESRSEVLRELMRAHPLAALVHVGSKGLDANHVPLVFDDMGGRCGLLRGHVARANPVFRELAAGSEVLAIFQGPSHYISPNWYPSKRAHGKDVPTWNYVVVHARGRLAWHDEPSWLGNFLGALTHGQEHQRAEPWHVTDAPAEYIDRMLKAIVGFEIPIDELTGKWKVSQNRTAEDRAGARAGLAGEENESARAIAALIPQD